MEQDIDAIWKEVVFKIIKYFTPAIIINCRLAELWKINRIQYIHVTVISLLPLRFSNFFFPNLGIFPFYGYAIVDSEPRINQP